LRSGASRRTASSGGTSVTAASRGACGQRPHPPRPARGRPGHNGRCEYADAGADRAAAGDRGGRSPGCSGRCCRSWSSSCCSCSGSAARRRRCPRSIPAPTWPTRSGSHRCRCPRPARCPGTGGRPARTWTRRRGRSGRR
jgi:hypothetical protein